LDNLLSAATTGLDNQTLAGAPGSKNRTPAVGAGSGYQTPAAGAGFDGVTRTTGGAAAARIVSIDLFRGLTILIMVFVNHLGHLDGIPAWMKHVPSGQDGMTFVDVVYPAFLFVVGMAFPLAIGRPLERGESRPRVRLQL